MRTNPWRDERQGSNGAPTLPVLDQLRKRLHGPLRGEDEAAVLAPDGPADAPPLEQALEARHALGLELVLQDRHKHGLAGEAVARRREELLVRVLRSRPGLEEQDGDLGRPGGGVAGHGLMRGWFGSGHDKFRLAGESHMVSQRDL